MFEKGQRVRINAPGLPSFGTVRALLDDGEDSVTLLVHDDDGRLHELLLTSDAPGVLYIREMQRLGLIKRAIIVCRRTSPRSGSTTSPVFWAAD